MYENHSDVSRRPRLSDQILSLGLGVGLGHISRPVEKVG